MKKTKIDWCDSTWNPVTGCLHGCEYCYARGIANRFKGGSSRADGTQHIPGIHSDFCVLGDKMLIAELEEPVYEKVNGKLKLAPYPYWFYPTLHKYRLDEYLNKKGRNIFVCSMADLFGSWVPDAWINEVMRACKEAPQHNYLFLTKNAKRYCEYGVPMDKNMWYGTSITTEKEMHLFNSLPAGCNTFVSIEPILEDLQVPKHNLLFQQVDWVIIGAETGKRKGKIVPERKWIESIVNECRKNGTPVFMKSSLAETWGEALIQEFPF